MKNLLLASLVAFSFNSKVKNICKTTILTNSKNVVTSAKSEGSGCQGVWVSEQG